MTANSPSPSSIPRDDDDSGALLAAILVEPRGICPELADMRGHAQLGPDHREKLAALLPPILGNVGDRYFSASELCDFARSKLAREAALRIALECLIGEAPPPPGTALPVSMGGGGIPYGKSAGHRGASRIFAPSVQRNEFYPGVEPFCNFSSAASASPAHRSSAFALGRLSADWRNVSR